MKKKTKNQRRVAETPSILSSAPTPCEEAAFRRYRGLCFTCGDLTDGEHNDKDTFT